MGEKFAVTDLAPSIERVQVVVLAPVQSPLQPTKENP
jgi:hypothetical protein